MNNTKRILPYLSVLILAACSGGNGSGPGASDAGSGQEQLILKGDRSFLDGYAPTNADGTINVVVEIPAGTTAKWEVSKPDGTMKWELVNGRPRVVNYLPYPGNYGMVPQTLLPKELGGDGDPLDVLVLGASVPRGSIVSAKLVGVLKLLDRGEQDDKLLAVSTDSPFSKIDDLDQLRTEFGGSLLIVETWFANYKGPGKMQSLGFANVASATNILNQAIAAYKE